MPELLSYCLEEENKIADHIFNWFSLISGYGIKKVPRGEADIYYGNNPVKSKITIKKDPDDILWQDLLKGNYETPLSGKINFDIINAITCFISDKVNSNRVPADYDAHSRLRFENSFQAVNHIEQIPVVNLYFNFLSCLITKITGHKPSGFFPQNKKCAICLSHDVDKPLRFQFLRDFGFNKNWGAKEKMYHTVRYIHNYSEYIFSSEKNKFSAFDRIIEEEKKYGFKSTFYFASGSGYSPWGGIHDVFYNIEWDEFKPVFKSIKENGFSVGLHASYNSYRDAQILKSEKEKLEKISGAKVTGLRHHYWHLDADKDRTLHNHSLAGFKYDSSIAFNDHIGFRRSAALPYYPVDINKNAIIPCLQIPVFCMDGNLFYKNMSTDEALGYLKTYIKTIKDSGGAAALDWHSETSFAQKGKLKKWGDTYLRILEYLSLDGEIWVTSPDELFWYYSKQEQNLPKPQL